MKCLSVIVIFLVIIFTNISLQAAGTGLKDPKLRSLRICQEAIKNVSRDYAATKVPYAKNYGSKGESYFAWNNKNPIKMVNGMGMLVPVSGSCIVDEASGHITSLTLNGKTIR